MFSRPGPRLCSTRAMLHHKPKRARTSQVTVGSRNALPKQNSTFISAHILVYTGRCHCDCAHSGYRHSRIGWRPGRWKPDHQPPDLLPLTWFCVLNDWKPGGVQRSVKLENDFEAIGADITRSYVLERFRKRLVAAWCIGRRASVGRNQLEGTETKVFVHLRRVPREMKQKMCT